MTEQAQRSDCCLPDSLAFNFLMQYPGVLTSVGGVGGRRCLLEQIPTVASALSDDSVWLLPDCQQSSSVPVSCLLHRNVATLVLVIAGHDCPIFDLMADLMADQRTLCPVTIDPLMLGPRGWP